MNTLGLELIWWSIQATMFASAGLVVYFVRGDGSGDRRVTASATLVILTGVSILALSPWPRWWTLAGPVRESVPQIATADAGAIGVQCCLWRSARFRGPAIDPAVERVLSRRRRSRAPGFSHRASGEPLASVAGWGEPDRAAWRMASHLALVGSRRVFFHCRGGHRTCPFSSGSLGGTSIPCPQPANDRPRAGEQVRQIATDMGFARPIEVRQSERLVTLSDDRLAAATRAAAALLQRLERCGAAGRAAHEIAHIVRGDYAAWLLAQASSAALLSSSRPLARAAVAAGSRNWPLTSLGPNCPAVARCISSH